MRFALTKHDKEELELDRDRRLMSLAGILMSGSLKATPMIHAKALAKSLADYTEICALLDASYITYEPTIDGLNEL